MPFNGKKVIEMAKKRRVKAYEFKAAVFPERSSGAFSWSQIENAKKPKAVTIEAIADFLQCPIDDLFDRRVKVIPSGDSISADHNSTAFKGTNSCDARLLELLAAKDDQISRLLSIIEQLNKNKPSISVEENMSET